MTDRPLLRQLPDAVLLLIWTALRCDRMAWNDEYSLIDRAEFCEDVDEELKRRNLWPMKENGGDCK